MCPSSSKSTHLSVSERTFSLCSVEVQRLTYDQIQLWLRSYNDSSSNHKVACLTLPLSLDKKLEDQIAVNCEQLSRERLNHS